MLLVVSSIYGFLSLSTEMGLAILAGSIGLAFSNIDKIHRKIRIVVGKELPEYRLYRKIIQLWNIIDISC